MYSLSRLGKSDIFIDIDESDFKGIIFHMLKHSRFSRKKEAFKRIMERENLGTTAIGYNVAVPHCRMKNFRGFYVKFALFKERLGYAAPSGDEIRFLFLVIGSEENSAYYLKSMSHIVRLIRKSAVRRALLKAGSKAEIRGILCRYKNEELEQKLCT